MERGKQDSISLNEAPDRFLVITQTGFPGTLLIGKENWRSDGTFLPSLSEHRDLEEAMLLMSASSWDTNCPGDICSGTGPESGECDFASTELREGCAAKLRYPEGAIQLNDEHDLPLLRQLAHSRFATRSQLTEFLRPGCTGCTDECRRTFNWRIKRLMDHSFLDRRTVPSLGAEHVYSLTTHSAARLEEIEERFSLP